jgi:hypothetical protein
MPFPADHIPSNMYIHPADLSWGSPEHMTNARMRVSAPAAFLERNA